jgi:hypothetical protein
MLGIVNTNVLVEPEVKVDNEDAVNVVALRIVVIVIPAPTDPEPLPAVYVTTIPGIKLAVDVTVYVVEPAAELPAPLSVIVVRVSCHALAASVIVPTAPPVAAPVS